MFKLVKTHVNVPGLWGEITLHQATEGNYINTVERHLKNGAGVNSRNQWGETPLHLAATEGRTKIVELLLKKEAEVDFRCYHNKDTALHRAAANGHTETVKLLLENGAGVNSCNKWRETALDLAVKRLFSPHR
ncbi:ankyrin repeat domain-containing protein [Rickettsiella massiliensis]|uniref:ankyrin repeat domain-containing protein n=1 Tax=Rickettsiella massiliensis TaxID=676517 RepID=UPI000299F8D2|nr:ankyrin repeat domain-containing protein [Rickettsiella massiliensis]